MSSVAQSVFTFLFKYPPRIFSQGEFRFVPALPVAILVAALVLALMVASYAAWGLRNVATRDRVVLAILRTVAFTLIILCLGRPSLLLTSAVPQRNVLAILLDDSRSMQIPDVDGSSRLAAEMRVFGDSTRLVRSLADKFSLRFFRFSTDAAHITGPGVLTGAGSRTDISAALSAVRQELADVPVAGIVLATDGADNAATDLDASLTALRAKSIPVYPVGIGAERFTRDLAIDRVDVPATTLAGSGVRVTATIGVRGVHSDSTSIIVEADGHIVDQEPLKLTAGQDVISIPLRVPPLAVGSHVLTVRIPPITGEEIADNNESRAVIRVRPGFERVLYLEGTPRFEFAFMRRAFETDSAVRLVGLLRSAKGKYLRINVADSLDLLGGFPTRRSELFQYRALVLGDIEATFFTGDQLRMIADFVDRRGGALIALGGRNALGEGGYAGTALSDVLPVTLETGGRRTTDTNVTSLKVEPTAEGLLHPAIQLGATEAITVARWDSLPAVTSVNNLGELRPGATVLLENRSDKRPVVVMQRYGRGIATVVGMQDSWLWKMNPRAPLNDHSYEDFWRQLVRWNLDQVPDRVDVTAIPARVGPGDAVTLRARVVDSEYVDVNNAVVTATLTSPSGKMSEISLDWTLKDDGTYAGHFVADEPGAWEYRVLAIAGHDSARSTVGAALADAHGADLDHAELRVPLLQRIARATGGKYYPIDGVSHLPDDVMLTKSGITAHETRDLWDMPALLLLLFLLLGLDWAWRRWRGLA